MVCSCTMSPNFVWLQIVFRSSVNETTLFFFLLALLKIAGSKIFILKSNKLNDRKIKQLLNSVIQKIS